MPCVTWAMDVKRARSRPGPQPASESRPVWAASEQTLDLVDHLRAVGRVVFVYVTAVRGDGLGDGIVRLRVVAHRAIVTGRRIRPQRCARPGETLLELPVQALRLRARDDR